MDLSLRAIPARESTIILPARLNYLVVPDLCKWNRIYPFASLKEGESDHNFQGKRRLKPLFPHKSWHLLIVY
jgi:hypothetical protein